MARNRAGGYVATSNDPQEHDLFAVEVRVAAPTQKAADDLLLAFSRVIRDEQTKQKRKQEQRAPSFSGRRRLSR